MENSVRGSTGRSSERPGGSDHAQAETRMALTVLAESLERHAADPRFEGPRTVQTRTAVAPALKRMSRWARWMTRLQAWFGRSQKQPALQNRRTLRSVKFDDFEASQLS